MCLAGIFCDRRCCTGQQRKRAAGFSVYLGQTTVCLKSSWTASHLYYSELRCNKTDEAEAVAVWPGVLLLLVSDQLAHRTNLFRYFCFAAPQLTISSRTLPISQVHSWGNAGWAALMLSASPRRLQEPNTWISKQINHKLVAMIFGRLDPLEHILYSVHILPKCIKLTRQTRWEIPPQPRCVTRRIVSGIWR